MKIGAVEDHRSREGGAMVYPVYSRRSKGLSVGVNFFPDHKVCSFDCPYCEVFPFETDIRFNIETMKSALRSAIIEAQEKDIPVRDICFSGNGEPTMSDHFSGALEAAGKIRGELVPSAVLVLITNGSGLLRKDMFEFLRGAATGPLALNIWLKLDAGTEAWYREMDRSEIPFGSLVRAIREFAAAAPFTLQTMICRVNGKLPPEEENAAWIKLVAELAAIGAAARSGIQKVQIYGKARPAPEDPLAEAVDPSYAEARAADLRAALDAEGPRKNGAEQIQVEVY
jgi:histidinol dehydrogenase